MEPAPLLVDEDEELSSIKRPGGVLFLLVLLITAATAVQRAGLPFSWLTGLAALAGAASLIRIHRRG